MQILRMKKAKVKIILFCLILVLLAAATFTATLAYLTSKPPAAVNQMQLAIIKTQVKETVPAPSDLGDTVYPDWDSASTGPTPTPVPVQPGQKIAKAPRLVNDGSTAPAYMRLTVSGGLDAFKDVVYNRASSTIDFTTGFNGEIFAEGYWIPDGPEEKVWYYSVPVPVGETTEPLFTVVQLKAEPDYYSNYSAGLVAITVKGDAIQAEYLTDAIGLIDLGEAQNDDERLALLKRAFALFASETISEP
jgi:hypothetical protein